MDITKMQKDFFEILGIDTTERKNPVKVIFKNGRETILEYYQSVEWIKKDRDVEIIIDNITGEIL